MYAEVDLSTLVFLGVNFWSQISRHLGAVWNQPLGFLRNLLLLISFIRLMKWPQMIRLLQHWTLLMTYFGLLPVLLISHTLSLWLLIRTSLLLNQRIVLLSISFDLTKVRPVKDQTACHFDSLKFSCSTFMLCLYKKVDIN